MLSNLQTLLSTLVERGQKDEGSVRLLAKHQKHVEIKSKP
jgi:hypothetical protein